ncbi:MAG: dockerin type I repeat-containing protein [Clostridia bacterium]|nr:dockerin type I repeat-containing protein [Clostridia bacterium]
MKKRIISVFIALAMLLGALPAFGVSAQPRDAMPEYLVSGGVRYRLDHGAGYYGSGEEDDPLQSFIVVAEEDGRYYALNENGGAVTASLLEPDGGELSGDAAVLRIAEWEGIFLRDGREMTLDIENAETGAASFGFGTQTGEGNHEWRAFAENGAVHRFVHYYYDYDHGITYGDQIWHLLFRNGAFVLSERTPYLDSGFPDGWELYVYQRVCEHEHKTFVPAAEPTCTAYGRKAHYECEDCGLMLDEDMNIYAARVDEEDGTGYEEHFGFWDFYTCPALGHCYDAESGVCLRCGGRAPVYEKVTDVTQLISGRRYLLINDETGLALDIARPSATDGGYDVPELISAPVESFELEGGLRTVYGSGGAAFYLQDAPATEEEAREKISERYDDEAEYPSCEYLVEVEGCFSFVPDYSWEYPNPLHFEDKSYALIEVANTIAGMEDEEEIEMYLDGLRMDWALNFTFLKNGDVGVNFFDGMHPMTFDGSTDYKFTLRDEWIYEEDCATDGDGMCLVDPDTGDYIWVITEIPTGVSLWREVVEGGEPEQAAGDLDNDGEITVSDALRALRIAAKLAEATPEALRIGDVDGDGEITVSDALRILRVAAKLADPSSLSS